MIRRGIAEGLLVLGLLVVQRCMECSGEDLTMIEGALKSLTDVLLQRQKSSWTLEMTSEV